MLSDEWLPRYGLKQNLKVADGNGNGNANADAKVTTIALPVLCTGELKTELIRKTSSPKGNDAHLRTIIQSEKKWKHQFFRRLRAANSVVGSGRISNSSKLLCMSSLPVSMKRIPSRTTKKKGASPFFKL